jgi:hypothetical protein
MAQVIDILDAAVFLLPVAFVAGLAVKAALGLAHHRVAH